MARHIRVASVILQLVATSLSAGPPTADEIEATSVPQPPSYTWPAFANWDCVASAEVVEWDKLHSELVDDFRAAQAPGAKRLSVPRHVIPAMHKSLSDMREECPLGSLYLLVLYTYEVVAEVGGKEAVMQAEVLIEELRRYPFFIIAGSRWPTYEALNHFSHLHASVTDKGKVTSCQQAHDLPNSSGVNWAKLLEVSNGWAKQQLEGLEPGEGNQGFEALIKEASDLMFEEHDRSDIAQQECPFGFLFFCVTQAQAAAVRLTGSFTHWARMVDRMLSQLPYFGISASKWPTFSVLAMFASMSKGGGSDSLSLGNFQADVHRWGLVHPQTKRFRQYGDLRLTQLELCPLGRDPKAWKSVDQLAETSYEIWYEAIWSRRASDQRPVYKEAFDAIMTVVRNMYFMGGAECGFSGITEDGCNARGCRWEKPAANAERSVPWCLRPGIKRKLVLVTFVWGEQWASLVPRFIAWAAKLRLGVVVVAMGEACRRACRTAASVVGGSGAVACWDPLHFNRKSGSSNAENGSILQRHAMVHLLLHLGIDALAFDFDTFFFADPRPRLEAIAAETGADVLMTRHLDADCLNMGLLYLRASARTAEWYSRYLDWLHQHPYEREQRGANTLLGFTKQKVSFRPRDLPQVKTVALDDFNEFASSRGGWLGDWSKLIFFHWVNPMQTHMHWRDIKISDLQALYDGALHPAVDIWNAGGSFASLLQTTDKFGMFKGLRDMMESMAVKEAPPRQKCW